MRLAVLVVAAVERPERERIFIRRKEVRLDGRLHIEALAEPSVARGVVGGKVGTSHSIVGENDSLREMPRRHPYDRIAGGGCGQHHDPVDEFQVGARCL